MDNEQRQPDQEGSELSPAPPDVPDEYEKMPGGITGKGWLPGQSGNPGGQPKGKRITTLIREALEREHEGKRVVEALAEIMIREALRGDFRFAKEILERIDGKVPDRITGDEDGGGLTVVFRRDKDD